MIEHGQKVRDLITGFEGIVTGHADYITGCHQYLVQPTVASDGSAREGKWYDEDRLRIIDATPISLAGQGGAARGADTPAPVK